MIATAEEYLQQIWRLYDGNVPKKAIILPSDETIYEIDLDTRTIKSPYLAGITKDQSAETVYFLVDRFFGEVDLANTACIVYYKNKTSGVTGFYPVPFFDITSFSAYITNDYIETAVKSGTYKKDKYYIKDDENNYILSSDDFDDNETYYLKNDTASNLKYEKVNITNSNYQAGNYYIVNDDLEYVKDNREDFHEDEHYYVEMEKRYINAHVEYSNYKANTYYVLDKDNKLVLDVGPFNKEQTYYSLIDQPKILFPWTIGTPATDEAGELEFAIRFFQVGTLDEDNENLLLYNLNTKTATTRIQETLDVVIDDEDFNGALDTPPEYWSQLAVKATVLEDIYYKLSLATSNDIYWIEA